MPRVRARLVKWGNSKAVRIPKAVLEHAGLQEGEELEIRVHEGVITIEPCCRKLTLEALVAGITPENRYEETDWGKAVGKEVW